MAMAWSHRSVVGYVGLTALLGASGCGSSVETLIAHGDYPEATRQCESNSDPVQRRECLDQVNEANQNRLLANSSYDAARQQCAEMTEKSAEQRCLRRVADAAFAKARETVDSAGLYAVALTAYVASGNETDANKQKRSSYSAATLALETGDDAEAERILRLGGYDAAVLPMTIAALYLRDPTVKRVPLAVERLERSGMSSTNAQRRVGETCLEALTWDLSPSQDYGRDGERVLGRLAEVAAVFDMCFDLAEQKLPDATLQRLSRTAQEHVLGAEKAFAKYEQASRDMKEDGDIVLGLAPRRFNEPMPDLDAICLDAGVAQAEALIRTLTAVLALGWAGQWTKSDKELARAREYMEKRALALDCWSKRGSKALKEAPLWVEAALNARRSAGTEPPLTPQMGQVGEVSPK